MQITSMPVRRRTAGVFALILAIGVLFPTGLAASQSGARGARHAGTLIVGSDVPYAAVWIDGQYTGMAPLSVQLPLGRYTVSVEARGYQEFRQVVDLRADTRIDARLTSRPSHTLRVTASVPSARVYVNGELRGVAPGSYTLPQGRYEVIVRAPGYEPFHGWIDMRSPSRFHAELVPQQATLTLDVPPALGGNRPPQAAVRIELNGRPVQAGTLNVSPGLHRVRYSSGAFFVDQEIFVEAGRHYHVRPHLELVVR